MTHLNDRSEAADYCGSCGSAWRCPQADRSTDRSTPAEGAENHRFRDSGTDHLMPVSGERSCVLVAPGGRAEIVRAHASVPESRAWART